MLLDIVGYIFLGLFFILGFIFLLWGAIISVALSIAITGAFLEDFRKLSRLFRK